MNRSIHIIVRDCDSQSAKMAPSDSWLPELPFVPLWKFKVPPSNLGGLATYLWLSDYGLNDTVRPVMLGPKRPRDFCLCVLDTRRHFPGTLSLELSYKATKSPSHMESPRVGTLVVSPAGLPTDSQHRCHFRWFQPQLPFDGNHMRYLKKRCPAGAMELSEHKKS